MAKQEGKFIFPCFYEDLPALRPDMKYAIGSVNWTRFDGQGFYFLFFIFYFISFQKINRTILKIK